MLQIDLSSLGGPELRQLLDTTRKRGQAKLSYQILQEMAARRERGGLPSSEPKVIAVDFGDPLERADEVYDDAPPEAVGEVLAEEARPKSRPRSRPESRPKSRQKPRPEPRAELRLEPRPEPRDEAQYEEDPMSDEADHAPLYLAGREPSGRPPPAAVGTGSAGAGSLGAASVLGAGRRGGPSYAHPPRRALWITVGFACGMAAEAALAWWVGVPGFAHRSAPVASASASGPMKPAQVAEAVLPPAVPPGPPLPVEGTAEATPAPAPAAAATGDAAPTAPAIATPAPAPAAAPAKAEAPSEPPPAAEPPAPRPVAQARADARAEARAKARAELAQDTADTPADTVKLAPAGPKGCDAQATPADRTICGDAKLQRLQRELRTAYAEALAAHQDRDTLRQRQLAWADARNGVSEPAALAKLYEERVRRLKAATEAAKRER